MEHWFCLLCVVPAVPIRMKSESKEGMDASFLFPKPFTAFVCVSRNKAFWDEKLAGGIPALQQKAADWDARLGRATGAWDAQIQREQAAGEAAFSSPVCMEAFPESAGLTVALKVQCQRFCWVGILQKKESLGTSVLLTLGLLLANYIAQCYFGSLDTSPAMWFVQKQAQRVDSGGFPVSHMYDDVAGTPPGRLQQQRTEQDNPRKQFEQNVLRQAQGLWNMLQGKGKDFPVISMH